MKKYPDNRLFSLDALRGLDMILLTVVGPLIMAAQASWNCFSPAFMRQFSHLWGGFTLWDLIMPLFIFMCGSAIPFALDRRLKEGRGIFWRHVLARVALLWIMGGLVQGNWITLDPKMMTPFSNTLQSIAVGYLTVALVMSFGSRALTIVVPIVLAVGYTLALASTGDYSQFGNVAFLVDHAILGAVLPAANRFVAQPSHYTWFLTSAMFAAMAFAGYHATRILQSAWSAWGKAGALLAYGVALLALGLVSEIWIPCIKQIFTLSSAAQAMGWSVLALDVLYVVTDVWKFRKGMAGVLLFGQMALVAYFVSHFFAPVLTSLAHLLGDGILSRLPKSCGAFGIRLLTVIAMTVVMLFWRRIKGSR